MSKYLSRADLERIAGTIVNQYYQAIPHVGTMPVPVDPMELANVVLGLEVGYLPLSEDGSILGVACFRPTELEVCGEDGNPYLVELCGHDIVLDSSLQTEDNIGRRNFTAAHEVAHHLLVRFYPEDYRNFLSCRKRILYRDARQYGDWDEWQANVMAAAILMPESTIRLCMPVFGLGANLGKTRSEWRPKEFARFCDMAFYFGVSKKALAIRMKELGLLDEGFLKSSGPFLEIGKDEWEDAV